MKQKIITVIIILFCISGQGFSQDTTHLTKHSNHTAYNHHNTVSKKSSGIVKQEGPQKMVPKAHIYRDTRLGGSSKKYNTYRKNDNGAGAITTNPNK